MPQNITIRLDEAILKQCRRAAAESDKSLSQWISEELVKAASAQDTRQSAKQRALKRLETGFSLGGRPLTREEIYNA